MLVLPFQLWAWNTAPVVISLKSTIVKPCVVNPPIVMIPLRGKSTSIPCGSESARYISSSEKLSNAEATTM